MHKKYIYNLKQNGVPKRIGGKANNLRFLINNQINVPITYVCIWDAKSDLQNNDSVFGILKDELKSKIDLGRDYAIRSSADIEDDFNQSFAGQFKTILGINGLDNIMDAINDVWKSAESPKIDSYLAKSGILNNNPKVAVIIQEMVKPLISGVSFSKNPITGMDEVIVEAIKGKGDSLVQEGVTPDRWVNKWGELIAQPEQSEINISLINEVIKQTKHIAKLYKRPVDLEWVYDGNDIYWVQLRDITSIREINIYSNKISKEMLPGQIKPLVWSVNIPLVNGAWISLLTELIGKNDIKPDDLSKPFYYRAYFNMGAFGQILEALGMPRESLEIMMGIGTEGNEKPKFKPSSKIYRHILRISAFAIDKLTFSKKANSFLPKIKSIYSDIVKTNLDLMNEGQLLYLSDKLFIITQRTAYYNIVIPLLMHFYNRLLLSQLSKLNIKPESIDFTSDIQELKDIDPNYHLEVLHNNFAKLPLETQSQIQKMSFSGLSNVEGAEDLRQSFENFINAFGHLSDSGNDFSSKPWREMPDILLQMVIDFSVLDSDKEGKTNYKSLHIQFIKKLSVGMIFKRVRKFRLYREQIGSIYTFGYGFFRYIFLTLGKRFSDRGLLNEPDDIFMLYLDEVKNAASAGSDDAGFKELVKTRKNEMESSQTITLPEIIYGNEIPPISVNFNSKLKGTPTSKGYYKGAVKVIKGIGDTGKISEGDILVIPYSDVGWTPLFAKAGAVIAESGGILSHSSIIAREYGIPAVVSVPNACSLKDDTIVTVDGFNGEVLIHDKQGVM